MEKPFGGQLKVFEGLNELITTVIKGMYMKEIVINVSAAKDFLALDEMNITNSPRRQCV